MTNKELQEKLGKETKYSKWYLLIIEKAKLKNRKRVKKNHKDYVYYENHHILPTSIFPEYKNLKDNPWNGILLTYREHILCHYLIYKHYKKLDMKYEYSKMSFALNGMLSRNKKKSLYFKSRLYENMKVDLIVAEETKKKISTSLLGHTTSKETKEKISKAHKGKKSSKETKEKLKVYANNPNHNNWLTDKNPSFIKMTCEYCNKEISYPNYIKFHSECCLNNPKHSKEYIKTEKERRSKIANHKECINPAGYNFLTNESKRYIKEEYYKNTYIIKYSKEVKIYELLLNDKLIIFITNKYLDKFIQENNLNVSQSFFGRNFRLKTKNFKSTKKNTKIFNNASFNYYNININKLKDFYIEKESWVFKPN